MAVGSVVGPVTGSYMTGQAHVPAGFTGRAREGARCSICFAVVSTLAPALGAA